MLAKNESFKVNVRQVLLLGMLGILFSMSSLTLFSAYKFVPAGLATTIIYLYPVFTAVIFMILSARECT